MWFLRISLFFIITSLLLAQNSDDSNYLKDKILVGGDLGLTFTTSDYSNVGTGFQLRGTGEYYLLNKNGHNVGIRAFLGLGSAVGKDSKYIPNKFNTDLFFISAGGLYSYKINKNIYPFAALGLAYLNFNPKDNSGDLLPNNAGNKYGNNIFFFNFEFGVKYFFTPDIAATLTLTTYNISNDNIDDINSGTSNDFIAGLGAGVMYGFTSPWKVEEKIPQKLPQGIDRKEEKKEIVKPKEETKKKEETEVTEKEPAKKSNVIETDSLKVNGKPTGVVHFAFGATELTRFEYVELDKLAAIMQKNPKSRWMIIGYTDNIEPIEVHQSLGIQRAYFVLRYFMSKGFERDRFEIKVMGEKNPVGDNSTEEGRAKNRRVEITEIK